MLVFSGPRCGSCFARTGLILHFPSHLRPLKHSHDPAPRRTFQPIFDRVYASLLEPRPENSVHLQQLALVYMLLAMGTVHNIELPPHDESAEEYLALAQAAMTKGNFMNHATIAGLQTLVSLLSFLLIICIG